MKRSLLYSLSTYNYLATRAITRSPPARSLPCVIFPRNVTVGCEIQGWQGRQHPRPTPPGNVLIFRQGSKRKSPASVDRHSDTWTTDAWLRPLTCVPRLKPWPVILLPVNLATMLLQQFLRFPPVWGESDPRSVAIISSSWSEPFKQEVEAFQEILEAIKRHLLAETNSSRNSTHMHIVFIHQSTTRQHFCFYSFGILFFISCSQTVSATDVWHSHIARWNPANIAFMLRYANIHLLGSSWETAFHWMMFFQLTPAPGVSLDTSECCSVSALRLLRAGQIILSLSVKKASLPGTKLPMRQGCVLLFSFPSCHCCPPSFGGRRRWPPSSPRSPKSCPIPCVSSWRSSTWRRQNFVKHEWKPAPALKRSPKLL